MRQTEVICASDENMYYSIFTINIVIASLSDFVLAYYWGKC